MAAEVAVDQTAIISSYQTRLNALLQRIKNIEILLMNREEEIEHEGFVAWKEEKNRKLGMLQSIYDQQIAAKKEELEDVHQNVQVNQELPNTNSSTSRDVDVEEEDDDDLYSFLLTNCKTSYDSFLNSSRHSAFSVFVAPFTVRIVTKSSSVASGILHISPSNRIHIL